MTDYTDDLCTGGTAISSGDWGVHVEASAFDNNAGTWWQAHASGVNKYIGYHFAEAYSIAKITISNSNSLIQNFSFRGSNNGSDWTTITTDTMVENTSVQTFTFSNSTAYTYYSLYLTSSYSPTGYHRVNEMEMMEEVPKAGGILKWFFAESWLKHDKIWTPKLAIPKLGEGYSY